MTDYLTRKIDFNDPKIASVIDEVSLWSSRFGALLLDNLALERGIEVLDVGCANGFPLFEMAHRYGSSCRFTGVDVWEAALERARMKCEVYSLENVSLVHADASDLPFPEASFDLIVSNLGVNNFENPQAALSECYRVAKPGARLILTTNVQGHMQEFYDVYRSVLEELGRSEYLERLAANEAHRGTKELHCAIVEEAGFKVSRTLEDRFYLRFLDGSALLRHSLVMIGFLGGWRGVVNPEDEEAVFLRLEQRLNELAEKQGELKMAVPMLYLEAGRG
jgi:ubiquinone/menaquinone biosynthesis C-methylase UbiE